MYQKVYKDYDCVLFSKMSFKVKRNLQLLKLLQKSKPATRKAILKTADKDLLLSICEWIDNILQGNIKLRPDHLKKLKRYAGVLRQLQNKSLGYNKRKALLIQHGGFLPALLAPIVTGIAGALISNLVRK